MNSSVRLSLDRNFSEVINLLFLPGLNILKTEKILQFRGHEALDVRGTSFQRKWLKKRIPLKGTHFVSFQRDTDPLKSMYFLRESAKLNFANENFFLYTILSFRSAKIFVVQLNKIASL